MQFVSFIVLLLMLYFYFTLLQIAALLVSLL